MKHALFPAALLWAASVSAGAADLAQTLQTHGQFTRLLAAVEAAGLMPMLRQSGPYTLFAPTDAAFQAMPPERAALLVPANQAELRTLLSYHIVIGRVGAGDWREKKILVKSASGLPLTIEGERGRVTIGEARASQTDIGADNGVIHAIDRVLTPPTPIAPKT